MMFLAAWVSKVSVRLAVTINMVNPNPAQYGRYSRRVVSGDKIESSPPEALCQGAGSPKCGSRASATRGEKREACNPSTHSVEVAKNARD